MDGFASSQQLDELCYASGPGLGLLCISDPIEHGIAIRAREGVEHRLCPRISQEGLLEIVGNISVGLSGVRRLPPTVRFRPLNFVLACPVHAPRSKQPLRNADV